MTNPKHWLEINLSRLDANLAVLRQWIGPQRARVCGVVKANAYGLGILPIARRLVGRNIDMLAVYDADQAAELLAANINAPLLILAPLRELRRGEPLYRAATLGQLHLSVHDQDQLLLLNSVGQTFGCQLPIHLYLDTGMSRGGVNAQQLATMFQMMPTLRYLRLAGLYTHFASAEHDLPFTERQFTLFKQAFEQHHGLMPKGAVLHAANTFATLRDRRYHCTMVRVGLGLFGYGDHLIPGAPRLLPVLRWVSRVTHLQRYAKGAPVGYDSTHHLERDSVLGLVPVGFGDGYPRSLGNHGLVRVLTTKSDLHPYAAVLGRVSMDQMVIDLTDVPSAQLNDPVELISDDPDSPIALHRLAERAASSCYEMLCRLSPRTVRRHVIDPPTIHIQAVQPMARPGAARQTSV